MRWEAELLINMQNKTKKKNNSQLIQIGFLLILLGMFLFGYQFFRNQRLKTFQTMNRKLYENQESEEKIKDVETKEITESESSEPKPESGISYSYIGMLEIPKIQLKQGFVSKEDQHNNVEENITILPESVYPDMPGNFILAAHSGTGAIAYFNELYHLQEHDTIYVSYQNKKYAYEVVKIYEQEKTGTLRIYRDRSKSTLTLITCTNHDKNTQTVYIANQIDVE